MVGIIATLPYFLLFIFEITVTIFILIIGVWLLWNWLIGQEANARRVTTNANK